MDDEHDEPDHRPRLVRLLVLEAGRIMEDASVACAMALPRDPVERLGTLNRLIQESAAIQASLHAALCLEGMDRLTGPGDTPGA